MPCLGRLQLVTDHRLGPRVPALVVAALSGGVDTVQVRVADGTGDRDAYALTVEVLRICRRYAVACLVNDRVDVALAAGADGVHLGADDLPIAVARRLLGPQAIVGATARDPATARRAQADGASYLGVGPFRSTRTKDGLPAPLGPAGLGAVAAAVQIPVIAIGGIMASDVPAVRAVGVHGVAVVSAVSAAADPAAAAARLAAAFDPATVNGGET